MEFPFETMQDPRAKRCTELFKWCCERDDKTEYHQELKFEEEKGEFVREYLIWDAHHSGVKAMAHRTTTLPKLHEEMIDCLITLARVKNWSEFFYMTPMGHVTVAPYSRFRTALNSRAFLHAIQAACDAMSEDEFYELLEQKLNKWVRILTAAGLDHLEGNTLAPANALTE